MSIAASILYSGMSFPEGRTKIVIDDMIFPTMYYVLRSMFPQMQFHTVKSRDSMTVPIDEMLDTIDEQTAQTEIRWLKSDTNRRHSTKNRSNQNGFDKSVFNCPLFSKHQ